MRKSAGIPQRPMAFRSNQNSFGTVHNYTASTEEKDALTAAGRMDDSIAWYGSRN